ncbi:hypothetical protein BD309DRAFT_702987 [Dichomitus squalens]|uniref:DUF5648 domain-containing protein n=2 Tax=Dichomitus squalens TaxID=114155 RepID=A0A4Q9MUA6_9APHY|nr:hypothetical protein BD311DRAFT_752746 [Dichomitus squalens]TBU45603.1 hypothetical protein BD309DRAFT_702987 [Dichomitus squalens]
MKFTLTAAFISTVLLSVTALAEPEAARLHPKRRTTAGFPALPLLRAYSPSAMDHFYTTNATEMKNAVTNLGYRQENNAATVHSDQTPITIPLYRLYSPSVTDHFYTTNATEKDNAVNNLRYRDEGIVAYVYETQAFGTVPLYRMYSPSVTDHFYTTNATEKDNAVTNLRYRDEGIAAYVNL